MPLSARPTATDVRTSGMLTRGAITLAAVGLATLGLTVPALAAPTATEGTVVEMQPTGLDEIVVRGTDKEKSPVTNSVGEFGMEIPAGSAPALVYCVDMNTDIQTDERPEYVEGPWDKAAHISPKDNLGKITWILHHSFPNTSATDVLRDAGATLSGADAKAKTLKKNTTATPSEAQALDLTVYAATQAAIWHYSDGFTLGDYSQDGSWGQAFEKIYTYLTQNAKNIADPGTAKLALTPVGVDSATVGGTVTFAVASNVGDVALTVTNGRAIDSAGKDVTQVADGGQFRLTTDTAGTVTVTGKANSAVPIGRVFTDKRDAANGQQANAGPANDSQAPEDQVTGEQRQVTKSKTVSHQQIILAGKTPVGTTAQAKATFTSAPMLPVTGVRANVIALGGAILLAAGIGVFLYSRRRRVNFQA